MASNAAVPFWRSAGVTYITYSNLCASMVRNCLKEPYRSEALSREKVHFSVSKWLNGKPEKPLTECLKVSTGSRKKKVASEGEGYWLAHMNRLLHTALSSEK